MDKNTMETDDEYVVIQIGIRKNHMKHLKF